MTPKIEDGIIQIWQQCHIGGDSIPTQTFFNLEEKKQKRIIDSAFDEFSQRDFENAKLSNIINDAKISRGSLYQYFKDKTDLYLYLISIIADKKLTYLKDDLQNPMELPFIELFKKMYRGGISFAVENPKMVSMTRLLILNKGEIFDKVFKGNNDQAIELYVSLIDRDKELGRIRKDIDSKVLAEIVVSMTINVSVDQMDESEDFDFDKMYERITQIMKIFEHGVLRGEWYV